MATAATGATIGYLLYKGCEKYNEWERKKQIRELVDSAGGVRIYPEGTKRLEKAYWLQKADAYKAKEGKQKDGCPKSNVSQNKQAEGARKEIEKELGRRLTKDEKREFHDHISGQDYGYQELVEEGYWLFHGR